MLIEAARLDDLYLPEDGYVDLLRGEKTIRLPIRAITVDEGMIINKKYSIPAAPIQHRKNANGDIEPFSNPSDPAYLEGVEQLNELRVKETILTGLKMDIPGDTTEERWDGLSKKLVGNEWQSILYAITSLSNPTKSDIEEVKNFSPRPLKKAKTDGK